MIGKPKKMPSALLYEKQCINRHSPSNFNASFSLLENIERFSKKNILSEMKKNEELKTIFDIIHQNNDFTVNGKKGSALINMALEKAIDATETSLSISIREKNLPLVKMESQFFIRRGIHDKALDIWEEILKVTPNDQYIHSKLLKIDHSPSRLKERTQALSKNYRFEYLGSFGHNRVKRPTAIIVLKDADKIFVSDSKTIQLIRIRLLHCFTSFKISTTLINLFRQFFT